MYVCCCCGTTETTLKNILKENPNISIDELIKMEIGDCCETCHETIKDMIKSMEKNNV
jgi:bacterioferritin-associated ferredoxin